MDIKKHLNTTKIYQELDDENQKYWFDFKQKKFLHNIDTFYYSVKLVEDFTDDSNDPNVAQFRKYFEKKKSFLASRYGESLPLMVLIVVLTFALAVLLVFSTSAYSARNGLTYLLLLLSLILLMAGCLLRLRLWYRLDLICYGCMECMKPLRDLIIM